MSYRLFVTTFFGQTGAYLQCHPSLIGDPIEILFQVDVNRTAGDGQAFATVARTIRTAKLTWVEPGKERWTVHLDDLKNLAHHGTRGEFDKFDWFKGKVEVQPEFRIIDQAHNLSGLGRSCPPDAYVVLTLQPERIMPKIPKVFVSYSWDDEPHKQWVHTFATKLRGDGIEAILDRWATAPGDQLPRFMEAAVRENEFVVIVCTPRYKEKSDKRIGGVGYEGDIMTGEVFFTGNRKKFIPVLRHGKPEESIPSWLAGTYFVDLRDDAGSQNNYHDLLLTLHRAREQAPPIGPPPKLTATVQATQHSPVIPAEPPSFEPIRITGILVDQVGRPTNDGSYGSALYAIPFKLSRRPSADWAAVLVENWNHPPEWTTMHRPRIASVQGDTIVLDGTTVEEVEMYHRKTLLLAVGETNRIIGEQEAKQQREAVRQREEKQKHEDSIREAAKRISFD